MPFKINISDKGRAFKLEIDNESLVGKKIGETIEGKELKKELEGCELEITGTSDIAGFPGFKEIEGSGLKRVLLTYGKGMHKKPRREGKKKVKSVKGLRLKKSVRGNTISKDTIQINMKVIKQGSKKLEEIFPEQEKAEEKKEVKEEKEEGKKQQKQTEQLQQKEKPQSIAEKETKEAEEIKEEKKEKPQEAKKEKIGEIEEKKTETEEAK